MHGQEVAPLRDRLREALDTYELLSGRRPPMDAVDPRRPNVQTAYRRFSRASRRVTIEPSRGEWIALELGCKPMLRLVVDASAWPAVQSSCQAKGYAALTLETPVDESCATGELCALPRVPTSAPALVVAFVGNDREQLAEAAAIDGEMRARQGTQSWWRARTRRLGELLGYPPCCVDHFALLDGDAPNVEVIRAAALRSFRFESLLNNLSLSLVHTISWFPCRYDCAASLELAHAVDRKLFEEHGRNHARVRHIWRMPRLYFDERRQLLFDGAVIHGQEVRYRTVHAPFDFDRNPRSPWLDWIFHVDVVQRVSHAQRIVVSGVALHVFKEDGTTEELSMGVAPVLLPFG